MGIADVPHETNRFVRDDRIDILDIVFVAQRITAKE